MSEDEDGTEGFSPQLAGRGKASHSHTSGFKRRMPDDRPAAKDKPAGDSHASSASNISRITEK